MKTEYLYPRFWKMLLSFYLVVLCALSLWPGDDFPQVEVSFLDPLAHFLLYLILSFFLHQLFSLKSRSLFFIAFIVGASLEILQNKMPHRSFDWFDIAANSVGAFLGIFLSSRYLSRFFLQLEQIRLKKLFFLLLFLSSCARLPLTRIEDAMSPARTPSDLQDSFSHESFFSALKKHITEMKKSSKVTDPMIFGEKRIEKAKYIASLEEILKHENDWTSWIRENFDFYEVYGGEERGEVLVTGYYEPHVLGSRSRTQEYSQALYGTPSDLVTINLKNFADRFPPDEKLGILKGRLENKNILPYYERKMIDSENKLQGQNLELAWIAPIDAFFIQIQGSGVIEFSDGEKQRVGYANQNGYPYVPIGKHLTDAIPLEKMSMQRIRAHLQTLSREQQQEIFNRNPSYVFFQKLETAALTYSGMEVIDGRTIATDSQFFPKGALAFLDVEEPEFKTPSDLEPSWWQKKPRFVFDQDTGGAIRGGGRVDLYFGQNEIAAQKAGVMKQRGRLYYLVPR